MTLTVPQAAYPEVLCAPQELQIAPMEAPQLLKRLAEIERSAWADVVYVHVVPRTSGRHRAFEMNAQLVYRASDKLHC